MATTVAAQFDGPTQKDGRGNVREVYSDGGVVQTLAYLADAGANKDTIATARLPFVVGQLADEEADRVVRRDVAPVLQFQTGSQFLDRLRAMYKKAADLECARLARWIANRVDAGDVTVLQIRTAFGMTSAQWTTFKVKLDNLRDRLNTIEAAAGE